MNNTKTKQIIAGLPEGEAMAWRDSGCNEYPEIDCGHRTAGFDTDDLKALAAAVPEWVPVSERLPTEGFYLVTRTDGLVSEDCWHRGEWNGVKHWGREQVIAWMPKIPPYQEDKDDIEEKIRKVTERGDAITGDEFEGQRR